jgi:hypothetical protein
LRCNLNGNTVWDFSDSKIIADFSVTEASVHDSQGLAGLIDGKDKEVKADSGYVGTKLREEIEWFSIKNAKRYTFKFLKEAVFNSSNFISSEPARNESCESLSFFIRPFI